MMKKVDFSKPLLIQSVAFKEIYLRMVGEGISKPLGSGAGTVNCQTTMDAAGQFKVHQRNDGAVAFESILYPGIYLRLAGNGIRSFAGAGAGLLNCQFGADAWEHFKLHEQPDGSYTIESAAFPNVYLRMDGNNPSKKTDNFGKVNCQYGAGSCEKFYLVNVPDTGKLQDLMGKMHM